MLKFRLAVWIIFKKPEQGLHALWKAPYYGAAFKPFKLWGLFTIIYMTQDLELPSFSREWRFSRNIPWLKKNMVKEAKDPWRWSWSCQLKVSRSKFPHFGGLRTTLSPPFWPIPSPIFWKKQLLKVKGFRGRWDLPSFPGQGSSGCSGLCEGYALTPTRLHLKWHSRTTSTSYAYNGTVGTVTS